jgi:hypothetical protein
MSYLILASEERVLLAGDVTGNSFSLISGTGGYLVHHPRKRRNAKRGRLLVERN